VVINEMFLNRERPSPPAEKEVFLRRPKVPQRAWSELEKREKEKKSLLGEELVLN